MYIMGYISLPNSLKLRVMKYILSILYKILIFIIFSILAIIVQIFSIIWNLRIKSIADPNCFPIWYNDYCKCYYNSLWDIATGRISFVRYDISSNTKYVDGFKYKTGYPIVKGRTKLFTYKV